MDANNERINYIYRRKYSTSRMLTDYVDKLYIPLCNLYNNYYAELGKVGELNEWKKA